MWRFCRTVISQKPAYGQSRFADISATCPDCAANLCSEIRSVRGQNNFAARLSTFLRGCPRHLASHVQGAIAQEVALGRQESQHFLAARRETHESVATVD